VSDRTNGAVTVRRAVQDETPWMRRLNNAAAPAVNRLGAAELQALLDWSEACLVVERSGIPEGFVLCLPGPGLDYGSDNYRWFSQAFERFLYVDRVVVDPDARSAGLGGALYGAVLTAARERSWPRVCAEVNLRPANPRSLAFHRRHGFRAVGEQDTEGGSKRVVLLERPVETS
jgi:predicted GNAT superfamily acetyltransferase